MKSSNLTLFFAIVGILFVAISLVAIPTYFSNYGTKKEVQRASDGDCANEEKISKDSSNDKVACNDNIVGEDNELVNSNSGRLAVDNNKGDVSSAENGKAGNSTVVDDNHENESKEKKYSYDSVLPKYVILEMENINQFPELPTGCESVALTMLLNYYGFNLDKTTIADNYLVYSDNFVIGYTGNPHSYDGGGCYSPGITKTANLFLDDKNSDLTAMNITGSKPEDIYIWIANDYPVLIWNTVYMLENQLTGIYEEYRGRTYQWDRCEHCMVICGYDMFNNKVIVNDPIDGIVERDATQFWERYEKLGSMAMVIE